MSNSATSKRSSHINETSDGHTPRMADRTQSPSPTDPSSRRISHTQASPSTSTSTASQPRPVALTRTDVTSAQPTATSSPTTKDVHTFSTGLLGGTANFTNMTVANSQGHMSAFSSVVSSKPASVSSGRRLPTHITNSVVANVVRNALPQESDSANSLMGLSVRFPSAVAAAEGGVFEGIITTPRQQQQQDDVPSVGEATATGSVSGGSTRGVPHGESPTGTLDGSSFSRERAVENFKKARDLVREHMKTQNEKLNYLLGSDGTASERSRSTKGGGADSPHGSTASASSGGTATGTVHGGEEATPMEGDGSRLYNVIRAAMHEADRIDKAENSDDDGIRSTNNWRDDDVGVMSPSSFFRLHTALESTSNRLMEAIIEKGHAAASEEELRWLYRHADLLNLLDKEDLDHILAKSLRREYTNGETIVGLNTTVGHLYTVLWGDVEVFRPTSLDMEKVALESAFRVTANRAVQQQQRKSGTRVSASPHDLIEIQTHKRDRSQSNALNSSRVFSGFSTEGGVAAGEDDDDVIYTHVATLLPGQVFGTETFVFDQQNQFVFRAGGSTKKTVVSLIPFEGLRNALARNPRFAQGVGSSIAGSVDVFGPIRQFCRYVFSPQSSQNDYLPLWSILESYTKINNVIHTKIFSVELDTGAWGYALGRLPENVTSTFCFDLVHALPPFVASRMRVEAYAADVSKVGATGADAVRARTAVAFIKTKERRRCTWHLGMEGKDLVLLRDGFTDLLDFLTMLCVHIVESNKLRGRVQGMVHPPAIDILDAYLRKKEEEASRREVVPADVELTRIKQVLARMPLTQEEQNGLLRNWGSETLLKIYEVMMHREEFNIRVDPSISRKFQINPFHEWALNLRGCVLEKLGLDRSHALPADVYIDVVSSNTHCIKNLLCSFVRKYKKEILEYAIRKECTKLGRPEEWHTVDDMVYVATTGFLRDERPDLKGEFQKSLEENGITVLHDTAMTGLQVDVIPVHVLNFDTIDETIRNTLQSYYEDAGRCGCGEPSDGTSGPSFRVRPTWAQVCKPIHVPVAAAFRHQRKSAKPSQQRASSPVSSRGTSEQASPNTTTEHQDPSRYRLRRHFIINMDFAFGAQAEGICRAIFGAFGHCIRSVSVMGKAGGLHGKRGDIQLASHVLLSKSSLILEDNQDELRSCRNQDLTKERLQELAGPRVDVHHGKVLTVTGTILQNEALLRYYKNVWRCVGTEMEGSYFARVIEDFYRQGIAHPELRTRFAYYSSDLPLAQSDAEKAAKSGKRHAGGSATLSAPMTPQEGVPPLYAIARGILENVLIS